jgi:hypothetical protein
MTGIDKQGTLQRLPRHMCLDGTTSVVGPFGLAACCALCECLQAQTGVAKADCSAGGFLADALGDLTTRLYIMPDQCLPWSGYQGKQSELCQSSCTAARLQSLIQTIQGKFTWTSATPLNSLPAMQQHIRQWGSVVTRFELHYGEASTVCDRHAERSVSFLGGGYHCLMLGRLLL